MAEKFDGAKDIAATTEIHQIIAIVICISMQIE